MSQPISLRSAIPAVAAMIFGLGLYHFDNWYEAMPNSWIKTCLDDFEILLMGPGMGVLVWFISEHIRLKERRHQSRLDQERENRFLLLGRIAASVAHEIRNPLHNLRLIDEELRAESPPSNKPLLDRLDANLMRIDHAVMLVYELARPHRLPDNGDLGEVSLVPLVEAAIAEAIHRHSHQLNLRHSPPEQPVLVGGRETALLIVLGNLMRNAVEAAGEGTVEISYQKEPGSWSVNIVNPGTLPSEVLEGGNPHTSLKPAGLGVGLGIARHLAFLGGGQLALSSNQGFVCARLTLPLVQRS